ncbi:MAG: cytochrome c/FTR1 family iron permease [Proteobacteria bacterium]|nr:cytochrome c/FTR1 family iron permease [Pseudomonadota bacterium]
MRAQAAIFFRRFSFLMALCAGGLFTPHVQAQDSAAAPVSAASDPTADVRQIWQLVDYIAVDYVGAVANGAVISEGEYAEMTEFAATIHSRLATLPAKEGQAALITQAEGLMAAISNRAAPTEVAQLANSLSAALVALYPVPVAPATAPDLGAAQALYADNCAACHGLEGRGDGETGAHLDPPPIAFTDHDRARVRSPFALYEVITQGVADTGMASFEQLPADQRWVLAFYVGNMSATPELRAQGEKLWQDSAAVRAAVPDLATLTAATEEKLASAIGAEQARAVTAYLRSSPGVAERPAAEGGLAIARARLAESVKAYEAGDARAAGQLALSSYLDGFEPVEGVLRTRDAGLLAQVETAMGEYRTRINAAAPVADVIAQAAVLRGLFDATDAALSPSADDGTAAFLGAFTILVREGVEALLVVVAMIGFLGKVDRRDVLPYVHGGWAAALVAGLITWAIAAYFFEIDGASREFTEGFAALFAAIILVAVGIWMHGKSLAGRWQAYLKEQISSALSKSSAWFLFGLAFVAVYREVFETILFYIALWARGSVGAIVGGFFAGVAVLAVITVVMLRTSKRLPISQFFAWSSALVALLAIVMAGKGVAALQEGGQLPPSVVNFPRFEILGVYPSLYSLLAQLAVIVVIVLGYFYNTRSAAKEHPKAA